METRPLLQRTVFHCETVCCKQFKDLTRDLSPNETHTVLMTPPTLQLYFLEVSPYSFADDVTTLPVPDSSMLGCTVHRSPSLPQPTRFKTITLQSRNADASFIFRIFPRRVFLASLPHQRCCNSALDAYLCRKPYHSSLHYTFIIAAAFVYTHRFFYPLLRDLALPYSKAAT